MKSEFFRNALAYSTTNFVSQFITLIRSFVVRRILPPEIMGFWSFVAVVQGFIATFDFGCIAGAGRELPIMRGKSNLKEEGKIWSSTIWFTLIQNFTVSIIALLYFVYNRANYTEWTMASAIAAIAIFGISSFHSIYITFFSGMQAFIPLSKVLLLGSFIEGFSFPVCAYLWGLSGIMITAVITACLKSLLFIFYGNLVGIYIRQRMYFDTLRRLLSFGFFLRLIDYPNALFAMANILWVTKFMSIADLALFSMARGFFMQVFDITNRVGTVYAMRFLDQGGRGMSRQVMSIQLRQYMIFQLLVAVPLLSLSAGIVLPFIIRHFLPKYSGANHAIIVLLICGFFYVLNSGLTNHWVLEKRLIARGIANTAGLFIMIIALAVPWFLFEKRSIDDVALSTLAGYFLYFVYMVIAVGKDFWRPVDSAKILFYVTIAAVWTFFVLNSGYDSIVDGAPFFEDLRATFFVGVWSLIAITPITLYGLKNSNVFK